MDDDLLLTGGVTKTLKEESILPTEVQSSETIYKVIKINLKYFVILVYTIVTFFR